MPVTGRGDHPLRSAWLRGRPGQRGGFLLRDTPLASDDRGAIFRDFLFEAASGSHSLTANGVATGAPTLGTPALVVGHVLVAVGVSAGAPAVGSAVIAQVHRWLARNLDAGAPTPGVPILTERAARNVAPLALADRSVAVDASPERGGVTIDPRQADAPTGDRSASVPVEPRGATA